MLSQILRRVNSERAPCGVAPRCGILLNNTWVMHRDAASCTRACLVVYSKWHDLLFLSAFLRRWCSRFLRGKTNIDARSNCCVLLVIQSLYITTIELVIIATLRGRLKGICRWIHYANMMAQLKTCLGVENTFAQRICFVLAPVSMCASTYTHPWWRRDSVTLHH